MESKTKRFCLYRANKNGDGTASQFNLRYDDKRDETFLFLQMASQTKKVTDSGHATFDWEESKAVFKMGMTDVCEILCVLEGKKAKVGASDGRFAGTLFHQNQGGNSSLAFERSDRGGYYMGLSIKRGEDLKKYRQHISESEGRGLSVLLRKAIERSYNW